MLGPEHGLDVGLVVGPGSLVLLVFEVVRVVVLHRGCVHQVHTARAVRDGHRLLLWLGSVFL